MNQKTINYSGAAIIGILFLCLILTIGFNQKNKKSLNAEKSTSANLLSEKQTLDNKLTTMMSDYRMLQDKCISDSNAIAAMEKRFTEIDRMTRALTKENGSLRRNEKELAELKKTKDALDIEYSRVKSENDRLSIQSENLQKSIDSLESEKKSLTAQLEKAKRYTTDNFLVTATRGKKAEKIVARASRVKKLTMAFEVPASLTETISFRIITPTGSTINPDDKSLSWFVPVQTRSLTASLVAIKGEFEQSRQVVLSYTPKGKLVKGEYKIEILSDGNNIGNFRIMLR